jgi:hypothetical protein
MAAEAKPSFCRRKAAQAVFLALGKENARVKREIMHSLCFTRPPMGQELWGDAYQTLEVLSFADLLGRFKSNKDRLRDLCAGEVARFPAIAQLWQLPSEERSQRPEWTEAVEYLCGLQLQREDLYDEQQVISDIVPRRFGRNVRFE